MKDPFAMLPVKSRTPSSTGILDQWVTQAQRLIGARGERTRWVLASTIVAAALQRAHMHDGTPLFVVKGGVFIERALDLRARATKDLDTLFRGAVAEFERTVDSALAEPWGVLEIKWRRSSTPARTPIDRRPRRISGCEISWTWS
ncbi:hypothetical protein ET445_07025 [Agromyces protaetiae]|uniref:Nucleotidyl transferase AbiEii/AbiGii toxin family protein n=1 Tax=Agromyces protaetiae TaxID=2509455 RepID=A0A4P6FBK0_9MICO|nr:hypothetical protein [Agromyces protaetiae]QAY73135.1 hypothetical protein ET445_07025 [Agromyces protaetiae]